MKRFVYTYNISSQNHNHEILWSNCSIDTITSTEMKSDILSLNSLPWWSPTWWYWLRTFCCTLPNYWIFCFSSDCQSNQKSCYLNRWLSKSTLSSLGSCEVFPILLVKPPNYKWSCVVIVTCFWPLRFLFRHISCNFKKSPFLFK